MLDIPRDLARITSSVLRNARSTDTKGKSSEGELRRLLEYVRKLIEKHCHTKDFQDPHNRELPCQSVSAFCFLRLIVQGILHPHLFGLYPGIEHSHHTLLKSDPPQVRLPHALR